MTYPELVSRNIVKAETLILDLRALLASSIGGERVVQELTRRGYDVRALLGREVTE